MTFEKKNKKISCALYITSKVTKNLIFRAHNLKYLKILTWLADSDFGFGFYVKNYLGNNLPFSNNKYKPIICGPVLLFKSVIIDNQPPTINGVKHRLVFMNHKLGTSWFIFCNQLSIIAYKVYKLLINKCKNECLNPHSFID